MIFCRVEPCQAPTISAYPYVPIAIFVERGDNIVFEYRIYLTSFMEVPEQVFVNICPEESMTLACEKQVAEAVLRY